MIPSTTGRVLRLKGTGTGTINGIIADGTNPANKLSIVKEDAGTWILNGNDTFSNGSTISGGVLQVGNGGSTGSLGLGNVVNQASLVFNRGTNFTFSRIISGAGNAYKNGERHPHARWQ